MQRPLIIIKHPRGFSLLEMVIGMFILALLATTTAKHQVLLLKTQQMSVNHWDTTRMERNQMLESSHS